MAHTNETPNYGLPEWLPSDKPTFLGDFNNAFEAIDNGMQANKTAAMQAKQIGESAMDAAGNAIEATHTNAAAISALTASLAETNRDVAGISPPTPNYYNSSGAVTGFGNELMQAIWMNNQNFLLFSQIYGNRLSKSMFELGSEESGLSQFYVVKGKLSLFGNSIDNTWNVGKPIFVFSMFNKTTFAPPHVVQMFRGNDGYYYAISPDEYNLMGENDQYYCSDYIFIPYSIRFWPAQ